MKKIVILLFILIFNLCAFELSTSKVKNANTVLVQITKKNISDVKLSFEKQNINFFKNPFKKDSFYALLPISYYKKFKTYRVIISYLEDEKRIFKGRDLKIIDGNSVKCPFCGTKYDKKIGQVLKYNIPMET